MSIVQPNVYSYKDAESIWPYGMAIVDGGICVGYTIDGFGLLSRGLLWERTQIWYDVSFYNTITTVWTAASLPTTTWVDSGVGALGDPPN